jgi:hypothetical protein
MAAPTLCRVSAAGSLHFDIAAPMLVFRLTEWGGIRPNTGGRDLDSRERNELPVPVASRAA